MSNLALLLRAQGKLDEVEPLSREALKARREVLGARHPHMLISINSLAALLQAQEKLDEAETLYRWTFKARAARRSARGS